MKTRISNLKYAAAPLALSLALISTPSFAQTEAADEVSEETGSEIVVTGSLIRNPNIESSSPVNVTTADEINLRQANATRDVIYNQWYRRGLAYSAIKSELTMDEKQFVEYMRNEIIRTIPGAVVSI